MHAEVYRAEVSCLEFTLKWFSKRYKWQNVNSHFPKSVVLNLVAHIKITWGAFKTPHVQVTPYKLNQSLWGWVPDISFKSSPADSCVTKVEKWWAYGCFLYFYFSQYLKIFIKVYIFKKQ